MDEKVIPNGIDEEISRGLNKLKTLDQASKEYKEALEAISRLHEMKLDTEKVELDYAAKREKTQLDAGRADEELRLKEAEEERLRDQAKAERREFWIKLGVDAGLMIANLGFFVLQFKRGYEFEKDGTFTSTTFREVRQKAFSSLFKRK